MSATPRIPFRAIAAVLLAAAIQPTTAAAQGGQATYELTFASTWSAQTHPASFPTNPHYSALIGGSHDAATTFWQVGGIATPGIEAMAELGATGALAAEVNAAIAAGGADQVLQFGGLPTSPSSMQVRFTVRAEFPRLTLVSMLAPSPDWFVGVSGLDLRPNGQWVDQLVVPLQLWDAGTDAGIWYTSPNQDQQPKLPIAPVSTTAGPFQGRSGLVGSYRLQRLTSTSVYGCGVNPPGSMTVGGALPRVGKTVLLSIDDPTGGMQAPAASGWVVAPAPSAAYPCGSRWVGFGMAAPGSAGELLVQPPLVGVTGPAWNGSPATLSLTIPQLPALIGNAVYVQGVLLDRTARPGLADAVELLIGSAN